MFKKLFNLVGAIIDKGLAIQSERRFGIFSRTVSSYYIAITLFILLTIIVSPALLFLWLANAYPENREFYTDAFFSVMFGLTALVALAIIDLIVKAIRGKTFGKSRPIGYSYKRYRRKL